MYSIPWALFWAIIPNQEGIILLSQKLVEEHGPFWRQNYCPASRNRIFSLMEQFYSLRQNFAQQAKFVLNWLKEELKVKN